MRRVIIFHASAQAPTWEWLQVDDIAPYWAERLETSQFFQHGPQPGYTYTQEIFHRHPGLQYNVAFRYDDSMLINYTEHESNIAVIRATKGKAVRNWRGPLIVIRQELDPNTGEDAEVGDMGLKDYSEMVAYLKLQSGKLEGSVSTEKSDKKNFSNSNFAEMTAALARNSLRTFDDIPHEFALQDPGKVSNEQNQNKNDTMMNDNKTLELKDPSPYEVDVVKYNCYGESATYGVPLAQTVKVSTTHPVFSTGVEISQISELIGMPLALWRYPAKTYPPGDNNNSDMGITFMMRNCDPTSDKFGQVPPHWRGGEVPNVLIVRTNKDTPDLQDIEWFGDWCAQDLMTHWQDVYEGLVTKQAVLDQITCTAWQEYRQSRVDNPRPASLTARDHLNETWDQ